MTTRVWRDREPRAAWQQMAIDLAMVEVARDTGFELLRLYRWREDSLSLGANESALGTWDREALERDGVPCVRRPTGGRGVWHAAADLTYAWAGASGGPAGVRERYRELHRRLAQSVGALGLAAELAGAPSRSPGLAGACFDAAVGGEVLVRGRKTIGSAQKVIGAMLLQHGAIALGGDPGAGHYRRGAPSAARTSLQDSLPEADALADRVVADWISAGAAPAGAELTSRILHASVQHETRFHDPGWTWRR